MHGLHSRSDPDIRMVSVRFEKFITYMVTDVKTERIEKDKS